MVWFYMSAAMNILNDWHHIADTMAAKHVPLPPLVLLVTLLLILMGSISLLFGYHARHGAVLLFGLTCVAAVPNFRPVFAPRPVVSWHLL